MNAHDLAEALKDIKRTRDSLRWQADLIADLFLESMRDASPTRVGEIKSKLQQFNSKTNKWKK